MLYILILGRVNYSEFPIQQYLEYPFLRELMTNGFEEIKTRLKEAILERIKTRKDLRDVFDYSFVGHNILIKSEKQDILKNKDLVCDLMYNDTLKRLQDSLEEPREPRVTYYPIETMLISEIIYKGGPSEEELSTKGLDELKLILKETILKWIQTQEGVDDISLWSYRDWYPEDYPTLCEFLKSLDEKALEEKDSVCEPFFNDIMNDLIHSIFENSEETNNILGIELIDGILFINEFSDIYSALSKRKPFRFDYIACNNLESCFIF